MNDSTTPQIPWRKEPLLHFVVLGALLFLAWSLMQTNARPEEEILVSRGQQQSLLDAFRQTWNRPPEADEFAGLLEDHLRQEIAWREGRKLGLDENDIVIRRRLRQKLELLAEDITRLDAPQESELADYLQQNAKAYQHEPRYGLRQIYFSPDQRGDDARAQALTALQELRLRPEDESLLNGDRSSLPVVLENRSRSDLARIFGTQFVDAVDELSAGQWLGPVPSGFGWHLVYLATREAARPASLEEVRAKVERDWLAERQKAAIDSLYQRLMENYSIEFEPLLDEAVGDRS